MQGHNLLLFLNSLGQNIRHLKAKWGHLPQNLMTRGLICFSLGVLDVTNRDGDGQNMYRWCCATAPSSDCFGYNTLKKTV